MTTAYSDCPAVQPECPVARRDFEEALRCLPVAAALLDTAATVSFANAPFGALVGRGADAVLGLRIQDFTLADDGPALQAAVSQVRAHATAVTLEQRCVRPDGSWFWVQASLARMAFPAEPVQVVLLVEEVTSRRVADETQARLAAIVASSDDAVVSKTLQGIITTWNTGAERIFGYSAAEAIGKPINLIVPPERADDVEHVLSVLRAGGRVDHYETQRIRKDGRRIDVSLTVSPIRDSTGRVVGASKIARDITERKLAEAALERSEARFRVMADSAPVLVWMSEPGGGCTWFNQPWLAFTGHALGQEVGEGWRGGVHPDDLQNWTQRYAAALAARQPFSLEYRLRRHDGVYRWVLATGVPLYDARGGITGYIGSAFDITERRQAEQEREGFLARERAARSEAERASQMKDEFLATVSHELRTPLNAILGWAHLLRSGRLKATDQVEGVEVIERNARVQARLIEDLLDMSRILSGKVRLELRGVDPVEPVQAALETLRLSAAAKGIDVQRMLDSGAGPVLADAARLEQITWNLLSNAIKFTPSGGRIQILLERVDSHVELRVADSGPGIGPDFLPYVFDRFRQADASTTRQHGGLGLGLSIAKQLVELHGGSIAVQGHGALQGATFTVRLPISAVLPSADPRAPATEGPSDSGAAPRLDGITVLVVDDEADARDVIRRVLEEHGAEVCTAAAAREGLAVLGDFQPGLIVSDIGMPLEDGYQFILAVRNHAAEGVRTVPAIALTAFARPEDRLRVLRCGYQAHLAKPVAPEELVVTVAALARPARQAAPAGGTVPV